MGWGGVVVGGVGVGWGNSGVAPGVTLTSYGKVDPGKLIKHITYNSSVGAGSGLVSVYVKSASTSVRKGGGRVLGGCPVVTIGKYDKGYIGGVLGSGKVGIVSAIGIRRVLRSDSFVTASPFELKRTKRRYIGLMAGRVGGEVGEI